MRALSVVRRRGVTCTAEGGKNQHLEGSYDWGRTNGVSCDKSTVRSRKGGLAADKHHGINEAVSRVDSLRPLTPVDTVHRRLRPPLSSMFHTRADGAILANLPGCCEGGNVWLTSFVVSGLCEVEVPQELNVERDAGGGRVCAERSRGVVVVKGQEKSGAGGCQRTSLNIGAR